MKLWCIMSLHPWVMDGQRRWCPRCGAVHRKITNAPWWSGKWYTVLNSQMSWGVLFIQVLVTIAFMVGMCGIVIAWWLWW